MKFEKINWLSIIFFIVLIALAFWARPIKEALEFVSGISEQTLASLATLAELKIAATSAASIKLPLLSGSFEGAENLLSQAFTYLEWSNILLAGQLIILTLSQSVLLKLLILSSFVFIFLERSHLFAKRLLIVFLLINPGLAFYTLTIKWIAQETKVSLGSDLSQQLKSSHADYIKKKKEQESQMKQKKQQQLQQAEAKGKDKISFFKRAEDSIEGTVEKVEDDVSLAFKDSVDVLKEAGKKIIALCLNLFTHFLFLFAILPLVYFWLMKSVLKRFFFHANQ